MGRSLLAEAGIKRAQLDAIAVSRGPGAFTGVRLAIALAQGIALALHKPVVAVSTLMAIAAAAPPPLRKQGSSKPLQAAEGEGLLYPSDNPSDAPHKILAAIDARMGEVYAGAFERNGEQLIAISPEVVAGPN